MSNTERSTHPDNGANGGRRVPLRTIEDLERHEREVSASERDAAMTVAALLRELAVRLPNDSPMIRRFADNANTLELYAHPEAWYGESCAVPVGTSLDAFTRALVERFEEAGTVPAGA